MAVCGEQTQPLKSAQSGSTPPDLLLGSGGAIALRLSSLSD